MLFITVFNIIIIIILTIRAGNVLRVCSIVLHALTSGRQPAAQNQRKNVFGAVLGVVGKLIASRVLREN